MYNVKIYLSLLGDFVADDIAENFSQQPEEMFEKGARNAGKKVRKFALATFAIAAKTTDDVYALLEERSHTLEELLEGVKKLRARKAVTVSCLQVVIRGMATPAETFPSVGLTVELITALARAATQFDVDMYG